MTVAIRAKAALKRGQSRLKRHAEKTVGEFEFQIEYYQKARREVFDKLERKELSSAQAQMIRDMVEKGKDRGLSPAECEKLLGILGHPEKKKMTASEARTIDALNNKIRELNEVILPYMLPKLSSMEFRPDDDTAQALQLIRARISGEPLPEGEFAEEEEPRLLSAP